MKCRPGCAACCVAISISSPLPAMPHGKPAGVICAHLDRATRLCMIWGTENYPPVCRNFAPAPGHCGASREEALALLAALEAATAPGKG